MNPDPKPGRWILPLVVLGMVAFTYFFVRALPEGSSVEAGDTTVTATGNSTPGDTTNTSVPTDPGTGTLDPETQAYLDGLAAIDTEMAALAEEMTAVNTGFDADPRAVEYSDAVSRLETLAATTQAQVDQLDTLTPPEALATNHDTIRTALTTAAAAANEALAGLQSTDDGSQRRNAVTAFAAAVSDFQTALANVRSAAGATPETTTVPEDTTDTTEADTGDA